MNTLIVLAHPRRNSLTGNVADIFASGIEADGHNVEWADLVAEEFNPVLLEQDEPDWNNSYRGYTPAVRKEMERVERNNVYRTCFDSRCGRSCPNSRACR